MLDAIDLVVFLNTHPPATWADEYDQRTTDERRELDDAAAALATAAGRLSAYISRRNSGGTHANAVQRQNQTARRIRQALGFTYTDDAITF